MNKKAHYDFVIVGAGIIGLCVADEIIQKCGKKTSILVIEKEDKVAEHASGRNSGVVHAGIYYANDSLKAKFCLDGGKKLKEYCEEYGLVYNQCGKLIVTKNEDEENTLDHLYSRAIQNGANVELLDKSEIRDIDPNVLTYERAIWSPNTASILPIQVCRSLLDSLQTKGVSFLFDTKVCDVSLDNNYVTCHDGKKIHYGKLINAAGLYADKLAKACGIGADYCLLPFKGLYLVSKNDQVRLKTNVYPVPNVDYPFLGVHFTITGDGKTKIGPTALPAFWRENYQGVSRFSLNELISILSWYSKAYIGNYFHFRELVKTEVKYCFSSNLLKEAQKMLSLDLKKGEFVKTRPGIRAQLYHKHDKKLVNDFVVEKHNNTIHVLNAVSPAFTCAFSVAKHLIEEIV
jgi:(S)-2-hydroxyglutarate dehydrogenase